jgi:hypothetical protein
MREEIALVTPIRGFVFCFCFLHYDVKEYNVFMLCVFSAVSAASAANASAAGAAADQSLTATGLADGQSSLREQQLLQLPAARR